jgi:hypothetical protein
VYTTSGGFDVIGRQNIASGKWPPSSLVLLTHSDT